MKFLEPVSFLTYPVHTLSGVDANRCAVVISDYQAFRNSEIVKWIKFAAC